MEAVQAPLVPVVNTPEEPQRERRKERQKNKKEQKEENVCCTITTVSSSQNLHESQKNIPEEACKLSIATNDPSIVTAKSSTITTVKIPVCKIRSPQPIVKLDVEIPDQVAQSTINDKNIPSAPIVDRKRLKDFVRRKRYKRPVAPTQDEMELMMTPQLEKLINSNRNNSAGVQEVIGKLKDRSATVKEQAAELKADTRTALKRMYHDDYHMKHHDCMIAWLGKQTPELLDIVKRLSVKPSVDWGAAKDTLKSDKLLRRMERANRELIDKIASTGIERVRCCDNYANLLRMFRTQESIVECHLMKLSPEASNSDKPRRIIGKNVLKHQIGILNDTQQYLLNKGLLHFTKKDSTPLKTWRQIIQLYARKQKQLNDKVAKITNDIEEQQTKIKEDLKLVESLTNDNYVTKLSEGLEESTVRAVASKEFKRLMQTQIETRKVIAQRNTEIRTTKQLLDVAWKELEEEKQKPKNYQSLVDEWKEIKTELQTEAGKLSKEKEMREQLKAQILENNGRIHRLQIHEHDLKTELKEIVQEKEMCEENYAEIFDHRKKLLMKSRQYKVN